MTEGDELTRAQLENLRQRVVNVVGHELRTPMTTMRGLAETLLSAADLEQVRDDIAPALVRMARRLERLLDDLLVSAGIDTPLPVDHAARADLGDAVRAAWANVESDQELRVEAQGEPWALVSPNSLRWALVHVLDNAAKYGRSPVTVRLRADDAEAEIEVDSPGDLVHPDEVDLVTEPFYRGFHAVTAAPGLGLGLTVARDLVRHAGGRLVFAERPGGGAVTRIILPCRP